MHGGFSVRSILTFALAVIVAALLWIASATTPAHAATDAHWGGDSIIYNNHGFTASTDTSDPTGTIPSGSTIFRTPIQNTGSGSSVSQKVFIIYFTSGVDPPTATSAEYVEFDFNKSTLSNAQNKKTLSLTEKSQQTANSSCAVDGVGWFICPISTFLANAMDNIFNILAGMIETQPPILGDSSNSMYVAWNIMRTVANVVFVIIFLIIIYSQLTSIGVSNYGIKKMIPRLIVAAVLVNVSFYVAALAIDVSNILGYSVQSIFNSVREGVFHLTNDNLGSSLTSPWATITTLILAGGGAYAGVYYMATGGLYLLMPLLVGLLLTVILVVVILAARQAIILILVIIAPLAFVANLLPNTEKYFDKWKDLFVTMLVFFPAFSLVFGGSQLAGQIIIQNAGDNIVMVLFGLAVQVAPLVITPLILKLSGGLLGKIAQIANNPKKGIIDRTRNTAQLRAEHAKQRNIAQGPRLRNPASWGAAAVRRSDYRKRRLTDNTDIWKQAATNRYEETPQYGGDEGIAARKANVDLHKERIHNDHAAHVEHLKTVQGTALHDTGRRAQVSKDALETQQQHVAGYYNMLRTVGGTDLNASNLGLETAKANSQASEQTLAAYLNQQRTFRATQLGAAAERLEATKLNAEGWQNRYTAHIDSLKFENGAGVTPNVGLANAAVFAQSSKEHAEAAQSRVQAMFDRDRATVGTVLNVSSVQLEGAKMSAETAKSLAAQYMSDEKATVGTELHLEKIRSEQAKLAAQVSETALNRVVEEYKTGGLERTGELSDLMDAMTSDVENLAAEAQGVAAAGNVQKKNIATAFTAKESYEDENGNMKKRPDSRAQELLNTAGSVDQYGGVRAEATATATLNDIVSKARSANEDLLEERAVGSNKTTLGYAMELIKGRLEGDTSDSEDLVQAAMEIIGKEAQIPLIRQMRMDPEHFNQEHLSAMLIRNNGIMKAKGGFDLQANPNLAGASEDVMNTSIATTLGSVSAKNYPNLKFIAIKSYADNISTIMSSVDTMMDSGNDTLRQDGFNAQTGLENAYLNLTIALKDPEIIRELGDNLESSIKLHQALHARFGNADRFVDYGPIMPASRITLPPRNP